MTRKEDVLELEKAIKIFKQNYMEVIKPDDKYEALGQDTTFFDLATSNNSDLKEEFETLVLKTKTELVQLKEDFIKAGEDTETYRSSLYAQTGVEHKSETILGRDWDIEIEEFKIDGETLIKLDYSNYNIADSTSLNQIFDDAITKASSQIEFAKFVDKKKAELEKTTKGHSLFKKSKIKKLEAELEQIEKDNPGRYELGSKIIEKDLLEKLIATKNLFEEKKQERTELANLLMEKQRIYYKELSNINNQKYQLSEKLNDCAETIFTLAFMNLYAEYCKLLEEGEKPDIKSLVDALSAEAETAAKEILNNIAENIEQYEILYKSAHSLHEDWREGRKNADGTFEPRWKPIKDQATIEKYSNMETLPATVRIVDGKFEQDIANTTYDELCLNYQIENFLAAKVVVEILSGKKIEDLNKIGEIIHDEWLKRNEWAKGGELDIPFKDLPLDEQEKDLKQYFIISKLVKKEKTKENTF